jgi:hypothetical protein
MSANRRPEVDEAKQDMSPGFYKSMLRVYDLHVRFDANLEQLRRGGRIMDVLDRHNIEECELTKLIYFNKSNFPSHTNKSNTQTAGAATAVGRAFDDIVHN